MKCTRSQLLSDTGTPRSKAQWEKFSSATSSEPKPRPASSATFWPLNHQRTPRGASTLWKPSPPPRCSCAETLPAPTTSANTTKPIQRFMDIAPFSSRLGRPPTKREPGPVRTNDVGSGGRVPGEPGPPAVRPGRVARGDRDVKPAGPGPPVLRSPRARGGGVPNPCEPGPVERQPSAMGGKAMGRRGASLGGAAVGGKEKDAWWPPTIGIGGSGFVPLAPS